MHGKLLLANVPNHREEWLKLRTNTIGSSEISTIVGLNRYQTPLQLWMEKTGRTPPKEDNDAMKLGRLMESFIGEKFSRDTGKLVQSADALFCHPIHQNFTASPDFWVIEETPYGQPAPTEVVECKNVNYRKADEWADGNCPDHAQIQLQWQLGVCGLSSGYVAGLVGAQVHDFHHRRFDADSSIIEQLFDSAHQFLTFIKSDTPPAAVAGDRPIIEADWLLTPTAVSLPETCLSVLQRYEEEYLKRREVEATLKTIKTNEDNLRATLEQLMGDNALAHCGNFSIEAKRINKGAYQVKPSSYVTFTVKKEGKKL